MAPGLSHAVKGDVCKYGDGNGNLREAEARVFVMHQQSDIYRRYDTDCDGRLSLKEIAKYETDQEIFVESVRGTIRRSRAVGQPIRVNTDGDTAEPIFSSYKEDPVSPDKVFYPYLRDSAEEVGVFDDPKPFASATGASFGYGRDGVASNTTWTAKGVAGIAYIWRGTDRPPQANTPYFVGFAASGWTLFNRLTNSSAALRSRQVDVLSFGGTGEAAFGNILYGTQYFRFRGAYNTDFEGDPRSWSTTAEWQPVSNRLGLSAPIELGPYLVAQIDPIVRLQHTVRMNGSLDPIFSEHDRVTRVGPVLVLNIRPKASDLILPNWLQKATFNATYSWLRDIDTRQTYELLNTAVAFPLDSEGHLGFKVGYQRGRIEETGARVDQIAAGLSAKW